MAETYGDVIEKKPEGFLFFPVDGLTEQGRRTEGQDQDLEEGKSTRGSHRTIA